MSLDRAETARLRAVDMLRRFGRDDDADRFQEMDASEYLEHKGIEPNPTSKLRSYMATQTSTKAELESILDEVTEILEDAFDPTISREAMAQKVSDALDLLSDEDGDEDGTDEADEADDEPGE